MGSVLVAAIQREKLLPQTSGADGAPLDALTALLARLASGADASDRSMLVAADVQRRADVMFLGFLFLGILNLLLLWLLGAETLTVRPPRGMQRLHSNAGSELNKQGSIVVQELPLSVVATSATLSPRVPRPPGQQHV